MLEQKKKETSTKWWQLLLGVVIIIALLVGVGFLVLGVWKVFKGLQKEVAAALIAASATILVSVLSVVGAKYYERKKAIEQEIREKKIPIYSEFVEFLFKLFLGEKASGQQMKEKDMEKFFMTFTQKIIVWGSDEVVSKYSRYRRLLINYNPNDDKTFGAMFELENLLLSIRKDIGHKSKKVNKGDLLGLFINDVDKHI